MPQISSRRTWDRPAEWRYPDRREIDDRIYQLQMQRRRNDEEAKNTGITPKFKFSTPSSQWLWEKWRQISTTPAPTKGHQVIDEVYDEEHFEDVAAQNMQNSALYRLPTELLLIIGTFLPHESTIYKNDAIMTFRATCRRFFYLLPGPQDSISHPRWPVNDRRSYTRLLKLAAFRELCSSERNAEGPSDRLVCSVCRSTHLRHCFTLLECRNPPETRSCIGAAGILILCPHVRLSYLQLKTRKRMDVVCDRRHYCGGHYSILGDRWEKPPNGIMRVVRTEDGEVKVDIELNLRVSDLEHTKTRRELEIDLMRKMVVRAVELANWRVCPHLHTRGAKEWLDFVPDERFLIEPHVCSLLKCGFGRWCDNRVMEWPVFRCRVEDCDTRCTLVRDRRAKGKGGGTVYLSLRIERFLGRMEGADESSWMAQIVEASGHEEDRLGDGWEEIGA